MAPLLLLLACGAAVLGLAVGVFVLYLVYAAMKGVPEKHRPMEPAMVWLLLIPLFNLYWSFRVYPPMLEGYNAALKEKDIPVKDDGRTMALAYCISLCLCVIPMVNILAGLVAFVTFIITLVKAYEFKRLVA